MAPVKPKVVATKKKFKVPAKSSSVKSKKGGSKPRPKSTKSNPSSKPSKKPRTYSEKELGISKLNMITPAGVQKAKGKKKGKVFVDDAESMMTILAMVNAEKEGQIESKMMRAREMEEIREARRKEADARQEQKKSKLEETKDSLRKRRKRKIDAELTSEATGNANKSQGRPKKRVSFG